MRFSLKDWVYPRTPPNRMSKPYINRTHKTSGNRQYDLPEALTNKFQAEEITFECNNFTYTFITKKTVKPLMITVQSTPLITEDGMGNALRAFGEIVKITKQGHKFAKNIYSGLRKIFLMLEDGVQIRDIPRSISTLDGMWRKLFFKGKLDLCGGCRTKHTYTKGCPVSHDEQQKQNNEQQAKTSSYGRNRTESAKTVQNVLTTENQQQPNTRHNRVESNKGVGKNSITGTPTCTQEEYFPLSSTLVSAIPRPIPVKCMGTPSFL